MRKFEVCIETRTESIIEIIEMDDDATEQDIAEAAKDAFFNTCNYGVREIISEDPNA